MAVRVHWDVPSLRTTGSDNLEPSVLGLESPIDEHGENIEEVHDGQPSGGSESDDDGSYASNSELTTNATESDLVGPGRTLGLFYSRAGRALENGLSKVARRMRARR